MHRFQNGLIIKQFVAVNIENLTQIEFEVYF